MYSTEGAALACSGRPGPGTRASGGGSDEEIHDARRGRRADPGGSCRDRRRRFVPVQLDRLHVARVDREVRTGDRDQGDARHLRFQRDPAGQAEAGRWRVRHCGAVTQFRRDSHYREVDPEDRRAIAAGVRIHRPEVAGTGMGSRQQLHRAVAVGHDLVHRRHRGIRRRHRHLRGCCSSRRRNCAAASECSVRRTRWYRWRRSISACLCATRIPRR